MKSIFFFRIIASSTVKAEMHCLEEDWSYTQAQRLCGLLIQCGAPMVLRGTLDSQHRAGASH